jgi:hypothetical protein
VRVVPTDFDLASRVGSVPHGAGADTTDVLDAHSVAVASMHGRAVVCWLPLAEAATRQPVSVIAATLPTMTSAVDISRQISSL